MQSIVYVNKCCYKIIIIKKTKIKIKIKKKIAAPVEADQPKLKMNSQAAPVTPLLANRPKRLLKPSLKVRENLGLI